MEFKRSLATFVVLRKKRLDVFGIFYLQSFAQLQINVGMYRSLQPFRCFPMSNARFV